MRTYQNIYKAPQKPAVYALYGDTGAGKYVAYVGIAGKDIISDPAFDSKIRSLFEGEPTGTIYLPNLSDLFEQVSDLEWRLGVIEKAMLELRKKNES